MAKENVTNKSVEDAFRTLAGDFKLSHVVVMSKELKDCTDTDKKTGEKVVTGHFWQLVVMDQQREYVLTTGDKPDHFGSICKTFREDRAAEYDLGFVLFQNKKDSNSYKMTIVDYRQCL